MVRDRMLILAAVTADEMGLAQIAAACRQRVLDHNAYHMLRDWETIAEARQDTRFQTYLRGLRRRCPPEKAEHMLVTLGVEWVNERAAYYSDEEYAAALLAGTPANAPAELAAGGNAARPWAPSRERWLWLAVALVGVVAAVVAWRFR